MQLNYAVIKLAKLIRKPDLHVFVIAISNSLQLNLIDT